MVQILSRCVPFTVIVASEVFSLSMSKKEELVQSFRRNIGILIKEETELVKGEVVEIQTDRSLTGVCTNFFLILSPLTACTFQVTKTGKLTSNTTCTDTIYEETIDAL